MRTPLSRPNHRWLVSLTILSLLLSGCGPARTFYFSEPKELSHYIDVATDIEEPDLESCSLDEVRHAKAPINIDEIGEEQFWDLGLEEAVQIALANSKVLRVINPAAARFTTNVPLGASDNIIRASDAANTIYDPAIAEADPNFGVEAALSAFDATLSSSAFWRKSHLPQNRVGLEVFGLPNTLSSEQADFTASLAKTNATGGTAAVRLNTNYDANNAGARAFRSAWTQDVIAEVRQPVLQGFGPKFNRIAGPGASPGNYRGVLIARITTDIRLADWECAVRNTVSDVENAYWDLYFAYRRLNALIGRGTLPVEEGGPGGVRVPPFGGGEFAERNVIRRDDRGREASRKLWIREHERIGVGEGSVAAEARTRQQFFDFHQQVIDASRNLAQAENRLRFMLGLAATDGRLIRPKDAPVSAPVHFDWHEIHCEAIARSCELRRIRWRVKQRQLELAAAKNFLLPRLDGVARYRWIGMGDDLIDPNGDGVFRSEAAGDSDAWSVLTDGEFQEWELGFEFSLPIGFRRELAGVRHAQLQLAREKAVLKDAELEVSHLLTEALHDLHNNYRLVEANFNRLVAARKEVDTFYAGYAEGERELGGLSVLDGLLDGQIRLAQAEIDYYRALVDYQKAITNVHFRKGSLLEYNNVYLSEGPWPGKAYYDAKERARARSAGMHMNYGTTMPGVMSRGKYPQFWHDHPHEGEGPTLAPAEEIPAPDPLPEDAEPE